MSRPWPAGAATGVGSLPGSDPLEAARLVVGELPDLPHLAELPGRGVGAAMTGRTAALLVDLPVEIVPSGWRLAAHPGRDLRRARDLLAWDLDALETAAEGWTGPLKLQAAGPWTLAATVELPSGHAVLSDAGAVRDLTESLVEGLRTHVAEVVRRIPGAVPVVQLDEPMLPSVLAGTVPTASGYGTLAAIDPAVAAQRLSAALSVAPEGGRVVHCCASAPPVALLREAGADALSLDLGVLTTADNDALGEAVEAGAALFLGVVPATDAAIGFEPARDRLRRWWSQLGFSPAQAADAVVPTPGCGLAGASTAHARRALSVVRDVGRSLLDAL